MRAASSQSCAPFKVIPSDQHYAVDVQPDDDKCHISAEVGTIFLFITTASFSKWKGAL